MAAFDDDDDWTGIPPEGRHSRDKANPEFWRRQLQVLPALCFAMLALIVAAAFLLR